MVLSSCGREYSPTGTYRRRGGAAGRGSAPTFHAGPSSAKAGEATEAEPPLAWSEREQSGPNQPGRQRHHRARHAPRPLHPLRHALLSSRSQPSPTKPAWQWQRAVPAPSRKQEPLCEHESGQRWLACGRRPASEGSERASSRSAAAPT